MENQTKGETFSKACDFLIYDKLFVILVKRLLTLNIIRQNYKIM